MNLTDEQWQKKLTPNQYQVLRKKGTETPFSGELLKNKQTGVYQCAGCEAVLFSSEHKFDSGSGWPSFYEVATTGAVEVRQDTSLGINRTEVLCKNCGGHLGHIFDDAPQTPTGQRYCINSCALDFRPIKK